MTLAITPDVPVVDPKDPEESIWVKFDFTRDLETGESISSIAGVTAAVHEGTDATPSAILSGSPAQIGVTPVIAQRIVTGLNQVDYVLQCKVNTTGGAAGTRILVLSMILPVREALA